MIDVEYTEGNELNAEYRDGDEMKTYCIVGFKDGKLIYRSEADAAAAMAHFLSFPSARLKFKKQQLANEREIQRWLMGWAKRGANESKIQQDRSKRAADGRSARRRDKRMTVRIAVKDRMAEGMKKTAAVRLVASREGIALSTVWSYLRDE